MAAKERAHLIQDFLTKHDIPTAINCALNQILKLDPLPDNPFDIMSNVIRENNTKKGESAILTQFEAGIIIDEEGFFNIELKIYAQTSLHSKCVGKCVKICKNRFEEYQDAIDMAEKISSAFCGCLSGDLVCSNQIGLDDSLKEAARLAEIDQYTTLLTSFKIAEVQGCKILDIPFYQYLSNLFTKTQDPISWHLTTPLVSLLPKHFEIESEVNIKELSIYAAEDISFREGSFLCLRIIHLLNKEIMEKHPENKVNLKAVLEVLENSCKECGVTLGEDVFLSMNCATYEFPKQEEGYSFSESKILKSEQLLEHYIQFAESYPCLKILEDSLHIDDESVNTLKEKLPNISLAFTKGENCILNIENLGSLTEVLNIAKEHTPFIICSGRDITNDTIMTDLCAAVGGRFFKVKSPVNGSGKSLSRLITIEEEIGTKISVKMVADNENTQKQTETLP